MAPSPATELAGGVDSLAGMPSRRTTTRAALLPTVLAAAMALSACASGPTTSAPAPARPGDGPTATTADPGPGPRSIPRSPIRLVPVVGSGLDAPVAMAPVPGRDELWVAEQGGRIRRVTLGGGSGPGTTGGTTATGAPDRGRLDPTPVLDLRALTVSGGERGLLGLVLSSDGRQLFVDHTIEGGDVVVARYAVTADGTVDPATRTVLLQIPHSRFANHNGGQLALGPDGFLYIGVGDGGGSGDPADNAQNPKVLLGKILRIDPEGATASTPYSVPASNPWADGQGGAPEVYLTGARNPWRFSFDPANGDLWVADVGQDHVEEIDWLPSSAGRGKGADLGWPWYEGNQRYRTTGTPPDGLIAPILTYTHDGGACAVVGGYVYRGADVPALDGVYVYGDYCKGQIRGLLARNGVVLDDAALGPQLDPGTLTSFGRDARGELYVLSAAGQLLRVERS